MVTTRPPKTIVQPTALGPVANTDTKLLVYGLFQKGRVLAQDGNVIIGTVTVIATATSAIRAPAVSNRIILPSHSTSRSCVPVVSKNTNALPSPWMCPEVRGKRTAPSTPSSEYHIRR